MVYVGKKVRNRFELLGDNLDVAQVIRAFFQLVALIAPLFKYSEKPIFPSAKVMASTGFIVRRLAKTVRFS